MAIITSRLKPLEKLDSEDWASTEDVIYNLNCLLGYFQAIEDFKAANTIYWAEQIIKYGNNTEIQSLS